MSANINIKQFDDMNVTGKDDRILYDTVHANGVIIGCTTTYLGSNILHVAAGYGVIKGALFQILEHDVEVELSQGGTKLGQLYIKLDLSQEDPIDIIAETADSLTPMTQEDDANFTNGVYEIQLCTFDVGTTIIENLVDTFPTVSDLPSYIQDRIEDNVGVDYTGTASASAVRYERIKVGTTYTEINGTKYMEQTKTLSTSASVTYTFTNAAITTNSVIEIFASIWGIVPDSVTVSAGSCAIVIPKQSSSVSCKVRIYIK